MKLSEAIRAGQKIVLEQGLDQIEQDYYREGEGCCAAGMALVAAGVPLSDRLREAIDDGTDQSPFLYAGLADLIPRALLPKHLRGNWAFDPTAEVLVTRLNDEDGWTPDDIAEYFEGIGR